MLDIKSCPVCWGTNLDATVIGQNDVTVICHDCGQIFEVKTTGSIPIKDGESNA
ncbi:hypothetical protein [Desulforamulus reducens]|uniref:hypothetical protein n=1 Tax=Desulforamulus reducens TaxID=59610 RepID=UPI0002F26EF2|nr:hypothetical protein [Desulforamulus reducens]